MATQLEINVIAWGIEDATLYVATVSDEAISKPIKKVSIIINKPLIELLT